jgi:hypothetical protein
MKFSSKLVAIAFAAGLFAACSPRNENTSESGIESEADSVETVAPDASGTPTDGGVPANPGSPADSAAQSVDRDSIR